MGNRCLKKAWKGKWQNFTLQWYSSDSKWSLWYSRNQIFIIRVYTARLIQGKKSIYLYNSKQRSLSRLILRGFFCRSSSQLPISDMIMAEYKQLLDFSVVSNSTLSKWCKKFGVCYKWYNTKCRCNNNLTLILCLQPAALLKTKLWRRCYLANFANFLKTFILQKICATLLLTYDHH